MNPIFLHRSIRKYKSTPIDPELINHILGAAVRASTTGNMQLYSIIVSTSSDIKEALSPLHFGQAMVKQAPAVVTFCADIHRFNKWCQQREASPSYDNLLWFVNAATDALLAAQNFALEAENNGLGICYLGTTIYSADKIIDVLKLPKGVVPVTTIIVGYPDEQPPLTDRLPIDAVVHYDTYKEYTSEEIDRIWKDKEELDFTKELIKQNGTDNLAKIFTDKRYKKEDNLLFSRKYMDILISQGFLNQ